MRMPRSIRRTDWRNGRSVTRWASAPLFVHSNGTASQGPDVYFSGPGSFFPPGAAKAFRTLARLVLPLRTFASHFIPPERKLRLNIRSNFHE